MSPIDPEIIDDLINRIVGVTKSPQSIPYYRQAIERLGPGIVEAEFGELRYQLKLGEIEDPARYLTKLLKNQMESASESDPKMHNGSDKSRLLDDGKKENIQSHLNSSPLELFEELRTIPTRKGEGVDQTAMELPYSSKTIPWATFIGPDFFTLSTNKAKSDQVMAKFHVKGGEVKRVPMIRGKYFAQDEPRGILTAEEGRILGALESIWVEQGCHFAKFENGAVTCICRAAVREVAHLLGWEQFGGKDLAHLKRKIINLKVKPYYLDLEAVEEFRLAGIKGYGFALVDGVELVEKAKHNREHTVLFIRFSDPYSRQLLARRVVSRPKEMLTMRGEIAFLLRLYLEPILISRGVGGEHAIELQNLIQVLHLPAAGWHKYKSRRKTQFSKAMQELGGMTTTAGLAMDLQIEQGLNPKDFMLVARLIVKENNTPTPPGVLQSTR